MTTNSDPSDPDLKELVASALEEQEVDARLSEKTEGEMLRYIAGLSDHQSRQLEEQLREHPDLAAEIETARETCAPLVTDEKRSALETSIRQSVDRALDSTPAGQTDGDTVRNLLEKLSEGLRHLFRTELAALPSLSLTPAFATGHAHAGDPGELSDNERQASVQARVKDGTLAVTVTSLACDDTGNPIDEGRGLRFACDQSSWTHESRLTRPFPDADFVQASASVPAGSQDFPEGAQLIVQLLPDA